jgi:hypothetical protein
MGKKTNNWKLPVTGVALIAVIITLLGIPLVFLAFILDFIGELLICVAVAFGGIGEYTTRKRRDSPGVKAFFGGLIIIGIIVLIFGFGKTSLILLMLTQYPFYVSMFFVMLGLWVAFKHRTDAAYGVISLLIGVIILLVCGMGVGIGIEFYIIIGLFILGLIIAKKKNIPFDIFRRKR